jgi:transposase-like protein
MNKISRRKFTAEFKSKVCIEALKERLTVEQLSKKFDLHPTQINLWKKEFIERAAVIFSKEQADDIEEKDKLIHSLYATIGEQKVANEFLKKKLQ